MFVVTSIVTVVAAPTGALRLATAGVLLVAVVAFVLMTRGPLRGATSRALLVCAAASIVSIFLSHNGIGEVPGSAVHLVHPRGLPG